MSASRGDRFAHSFALIAACVIVLLSIGQKCEALSSKECKQTVADKFRRGESDCGHPICGYLEVDHTGPRFLDQLSLECQALMWSYRDDTSPLLGVTGAASRICATSKEAYQPANPIIVETDEFSNFMICTVPRAASTNLRQLLNVLIRDQQWDAHFDVYPTVWHYRMDSHPTYDYYPSFIIGRNPYTRVLSGFLNKMTIEFGQPDAWTAKSVNAELRMPPTKTWQRTPESFREFILALNKRRYGVSYMDPHFRLATRACTYGIRYEYYLRVEDLAMWLPCMEQGLGLREVLRHGWERSPEGLLYTGGHSGDTEGDCWWKPPGMTCAEFYELMVNDAGEVVPVRAGVDGDFRLHEGRDDGTAGNWREFYTQQIGDIVYKLYEEDFLTFGYAKELFE